MSTKFTPGPWVVEPANEPDEGAVVVRYWQDGDEETRVTPQIIASVECDEGGDGSIPNAQLIAAAPDLYAALQALADTCERESMVAVVFESLAQPMESLAQARAALEKARGGEVSE